MQKIKGKRGASISLPGQDQDQIRGLRRAKFEEFSGICCNEKQAREQQEGTSSGVVDARTFS